MFLFNAFANTVSLSGLRVVCVIGFFLMEKLIFPGKEIAVSEEAEAAGGTVEDGGVIYAAVVGEAGLHGGIARVANPASPRLLAKGDLVLGRIEDLFDQVALVSFKPLERKVVSSADRAFLRISEIKGRSGGFVESFKGFLSIGDVIKARVIEVTDLGVYLSIAGSGLGVVKAFCGSCRSELNSDLECKGCMRKERRKMAL